MANGKLAEILRAQSSFTAEQIFGMSDAEGWSWVYNQPRKSRANAPAVAFTGFVESDLKRLSRIALDAGLRISPTVRAYTQILCVGAPPYSLEVNAAEVFQLVAVSEETFLSLLKAGDLHNMRHQEYECE